MAPTNPDYTTYTTLSFDCYGTLIDWERGITADLAPLLTHLPPTHPFHATPKLALLRFNALSEHLWATQPKLAYDANLTEAFRLLAQEVAQESGIKGPLVSEEDLQKIGTGPGRWPAFTDTVDALKRLGNRYKLVILSNVNEANIARAVAGPLAGARFDAVYTAEAIGSYKPAKANFEYLFAGVKKEFGVERPAADDGEKGTKGGLLHVARSLTADVVPATELGLKTVWIARGGDTPEGYGTGGDYLKLKGEGKVVFEGVFQTLGEFADEVDRQFGEKEQKE
ncbi:Haloacid dehalogenase-like hydrolase-domain-containing protein [Dichotomopilus funicola]|uniref:Haloacid dehalogenase-like hydrolase-domain-containing protein n=1 Tax=Dichotomopilus funicola TaxID=1934379 RepID=A0AAN6ZNB5_9PEZI|nr:Haloacid dehalogenase-like hydrolase-domain-containing protein [Dichotomopilus funicola]